MKDKVWVFALCIIAALLIARVLFSLDDYDNAKCNNVFPDIATFYEYDNFKDLLFKKDEQKRNSSIQELIFSNNKFNYTKAVKYYYKQKNNTLQTTCLKIVLMSTNTENKALIQDFLSIVLKGDYDAEKLFDENKRLKKNIVLNNYQIKSYRVYSKRFGEIIEVHISMKGYNEE